jgi:hypothetical protein
MELWAVINDILDRVKIRIVTTSGQEMLRDLRIYPYSNGLELGSKSSNPWDCAFIRCDDAERTDLVDMKADILWAMYYSEHNQDGGSNGWGDVPVVVCDTFYCGAYKKIVEVDGVPIHTYEVGNSSLCFRWIHFNVNTGEVKAL